MRRAFETQLPEYKIPPQSEIFPTAMLFRYGWLDQEKSCPLLQDVLTTIRVPTTRAITGETTLLQMTHFVNSLNKQDSETMYLLSK